MFPGMMPALALPGRNEAGTVGADQARRGPFRQERHRAQHVERRNAFGDAHDERETRVGGFHHCVGGKRRRDEHHGGIGAGLRDGVVDGVEDRPALVGRSAFPGRDAADDGGAVRRRLLGVKRPFAAGQALDNQTRGCIDENGHS
jgi:hypothetical protein